MDTSTSITFTSVSTIVGEREKGIREKVCDKKQEDRLEMTIIVYSMFT